MFRRHGATDGVAATLNNLGLTAHDTVLATPGAARPEVEAP
ncbi:hypothetical protein [Saccharothrix luteola]|nr:hypothetical protein [Saccharothrix luteola]